MKKLLLQLIFDNPRSSIVTGIAPDPLFLFTFYFPLSQFSLTFSVFHIIRFLWMYSSLFMCYLVSAIMMDNEDTIGYNLIYNPIFPRIYTNFLGTKSRLPQGKILVDNINFSSIVHICILKIICRA